MSATLTPAPSIGDINPSDIVYAIFNTHQATMAPFTLAGTPSLSCYKDDSVTQSTAGLTLTVDFDSLTGMNMVKIDTSADGTFYAAGHDYTVVVAAGTVNSISAIGYVVARFSIGRGVNVKRWNATAVPSEDTAGYPKVTIKDGTGTGEIDTTSGGVLVAAHSAAAKTEINDQVVDALATDTYAEPAQGAPGATISLAAKINWLYKAFRNKKTQTSTVWSLFNDDASTVDHKATLSNDGSTATKSEIASGP